MQRRSIVFHGTVQRIRSAALTAALTAAALAPAPGAAAAVPVVRELPGQRPVVVRWTARTHREGMTFVVLRGDSPDRLVPVSRLAASLGEGSYRFADPHLLRGETLIQLQAVDAEGRATVLETVLCRPRSDLATGHDVVPPAAAARLALAAAPAACLPPDPGDGAFPRLSLPASVAVDRSLEDPPPELAVRTARA